VYPQGDKVLNVVKKQSKIKEAKIFEVNKMDALRTSENLDYQSFKYLKSDVFQLDEINLKLLGEHQIYNALTALRVLELLKSSGYNINSKSVKEGLGGCSFPGRFEVIGTDPVIIIDGGHNINGIEYFSRTVKEQFANQKIILFFGMLKDKNPKDVIQYLLPISKKIYTLTPDNPRAMNSSELAKLMRVHSRIEVTPIADYKEISAIVNKQSKDEVIAFVGSLYMIGEVRTLLLKDKRSKETF
jgi:dihydrofolate synthase/folylpolyglutamate synthase